MSYARVVDAPKPKYIVITLHDEQEQTINFYVSREKAREDYALQLAMHNDAYIAELLA
jgi:hypothetical protein